MPDRSDNLWTTLRGLVERVPRKTQQNTWTFDMQITDWRDWAPCRGAV